MTRESLHPRAIPEDSTNAGVAGWIAWPRGRQWFLILAVLVATGVLFAYHLSPR